jgi:hypothetical protein
VLYTADSDSPLSYFLPASFRDQIRFQSQLCMARFMTILRIRDVIPLLYVPYPTAVRSRVRPPAVPVVPHRVRRRKPGVGSGATPRPGANQVSCILYVVGRLFSSLNLNLIPHFLNSCSFYLKITLFIITLPVTYNSAVVTELTRNNPAPALVLPPSSNTHNKRFCVMQPSIFHT